MYEIRFRYAMYEYIYVKYSKTVEYLIYRMYNYNCSYREVFLLKIRLNINDADYEKIEKELHEHGIETDDAADLVLSKVNGFAEKLIVKDKTTNERIILSCDDIVSFESYGHLIDVRTKDNIYYVNERLYRIFEQLDKMKFLRISNSVIISKNQIKKISPTLSMKFILTLSDNSRVDVTRTYYQSFKETIGI